MNDVVLNKRVSIERCVERVQHYMAAETGLPFEQDTLKQDGVALNLQRACQQCIDLANHWVRVRKLGLPQTSLDAFLLLQEEGLISQELCDSMKGLIGFRNVLVHAYQKLDPLIMKRVAEQRLQDMLAFADAALQALT